MALIDREARRIETLEMALLVQGASLSMMSKILGGGSSRSSSADEDDE